MKTGWIKSIRGFKTMTFISATDGSKDYQLTIKEGADVKGEFKIGASFIAEGEDSETPRGLYEFLVSKIEVVGKSDDDFPIQPKEHGAEFLRSIPETRGRAKGYQAIWKMRHHLTQGIHRHLESEGCYQYYTPIITDADCEGGGDQFQVKSSWLDQGLTVSGQLHGEVGMMSLGKIYTFGPTFRAEKSMTRKHLSEFWMVEPELAFYDLDKTVDFAEDFVKGSMKYVLEKSEFEFQQLDITSEHIQDLLDKKWHRMKYEDVVKEFGVAFGEDVSSEVEKAVVAKYGPTFITHYAWGLKPFYMKKEGETAACFDLIFPEVGEVIGGSQREEDYDILLEQMGKQGLDAEKMDWYLKTRRWGTVPHSGFGLGFERLLMYLVKAQKVHDVIPFPVSY